MGFYINTEENGSSFVSRIAGDVEITEAEYNEMKVMEHIIDAESKLYDALWELNQAIDKSNGGTKYSLMHFKSGLAEFLDHDNGEAGFRPFVRLMEREAKKRRRTSFS